MKERQIGNFLPSPGSILSMLLIGLVLLGGLVYYRAIKIQRFLEPALALSQPRNEFTKRISSLFQKEFGKKPMKGLEFKMGTIHVSQSLLIAPDGTVRESGREIVRKIARVLASLMSDEQARAEISLILISTSTPPPGSDSLTVRLNSHVLAGLIKDAMFHAEPELGRHASSFATVTRYRDANSANGDIDIRIIPSEFLHIKVLERLEKYSY